MNFVQIITGLVIGIALGYAMYFIRHASNLIKFLVCVFMSIAIPVVSEVTTFHESKYVGLVFFGWAAFRVWGHHKPEKELDSLWTILTPFLYATVGASIKFAEISGSMIGNAIAVILIGITFRWIGTFLACMERKFNNKERAFIACGWIPKATVQAALASITLMEVAKHKLEEPYITYAQEMLTGAVFSIVITAPIGAILISSLGTKFLTRDETNNPDQSKEN